MSRKNSRQAKAARRTAVRSRTPLERTDPELRRVDPEKIRAEALAELVEEGASQETAERGAEYWAAQETYRDSLYQVVVHRKDGAVRVLAVTPLEDDGPEPGWAVLQRIKDELAGPEAEAFQAYPAESRLIDVNDTYWIWVLPLGERVNAGFAVRTNSGIDIRTPVIDGIVPDGYADAPRTVESEART